MSSGGNTPRPHRHRRGGGGGRGGAWRTELASLAARHTLSASTGVMPAPLGPWLPEDHSRRSALAAFLAVRPAVPLWSTQERAVAFMAMRAATPLTEAGVRGGLLCLPARDGKTRAVLHFLQSDRQRRVAQGEERFGRPDLVVVPPTALAVWPAENDALWSRHPAALRLVVVETAQLLALEAHTLALHYDVIVTSYATLTAAGAAHVLQRLRYRFLIADEAHLIVNEGTARHAMLRPGALHADVRWFVSATPIQNHAHDLQAAMAFVGMPPEATQTLGAALQWRADLILTSADPVSDMVELPVTRLEWATAHERALFEANARDVAALYGDSARQGQAFAVRAMHRLASLCLLPVPMQRADLVVPPGLLLPPPAWLPRRHGSTSEDATAEDEPDSVPSIERDAAEALVAVALRPDLGQDGEALAPLARRAYDRLAQVERDPARLAARWDAYGSRVDAARAAMLSPVTSKERAVCNTILWAQTERAGEKVLLVSTRLQALDHLMRLLEYRRVVLGLPGAKRYLLLHGAQTNEERQRVMFQLAHDPGVGGLLMTLKVGCVGIDLPAANWVVLLDPWYNPFAEYQVAKRPTGVNQRRAHVHVVRFAMADSIDEVIVDIGREKLALHRLILPAYTPPVQDEDGESVVVCAGDTDETLADVDAAHAQRVARAFIARWRELKPEDMDTG